MEILFDSFSYISDMDECSNNPSHSNATCNMCACAPGYSSDGFHSTCVHLISYQENDTQNIYNYVVIERNDNKNSIMCRYLFFYCKTEKYQILNAFCLLKF